MDDDDNEGKKVKRRGKSNRAQTVANVNKPRKGKLNERTMKEAELNEEESSIDLSVNNSAQMVEPHAKVEAHYSGAENIPSAKGLNRNSTPKKGTVPT